MPKELLDSNCYNCQHPIAATDKYCGKCGQKHHDGKYSVGEVISEFISANFNLDAKIFQTLAGLINPGYLTEQYFKGVHKKYYKPVRLFLVLGIIVFAFMSPDMSGTQDMMKQIEEKETEKLYEAKWDSLKSEIGTLTSDNNLLSALDTMYLNNNLALLNLEAKDPSKRKNNNFSVNIGETRATFNRYNDSVEIFGTKFSNKDFLDHEPKEFVDKFFPDRKWFEKLAMRQFIKVMRDGNSLMDYVMNRLPIFLLFLTPIYALVYWLIYIRRKRFFVEHFVFLLHLNSAALVFILLSYFLIQTFEIEALGGGTVIAYLIYYFLALKRYYQQGKIKTFLKFILLNIASTIVGLIALVVILLLGVLLF